MTTPAAEQRKLLDQLMGRELRPFSTRHFNSGARTATGSRYYSQHHQPLHDYRRRDLGLYDPRICKAYLVGECPYDLFQGTKQSLGRCPQIHLAKYKLRYEREIKSGKRFPEFEREYYMILSKFINDCNGHIAVALKNLEHTPEEKERIKRVTEELDVLDTKLGLMMKEIDVLVKNNEVAKAMLQSAKLQELQGRRREVARKVRNITENVGQSAQQKLQVCEVCGAYLSRLDTDRRLADHFMGKIHLGYVKMREDYEYYKKRLSSATVADA